MTFGLIIGLIVTAGAGAAAAYILPGAAVSSSVLGQERKLEEVRAEAEEIRKEAKAQIERMKTAFEQEEQSMQESIQRLNNAVEQKEDILKRRGDRNKSYEGNLKGLQKEIKQMNTKKEETISNILSKLSSASGMSKDEALEKARTDLKEVITENKEIRQNAELEEYSEDIMRHASAILQIVVQRLGVQSSVDKNSSSINVKNDKFKGLLAGKNGRNVAYLESLLPVSIIFNLGDANTIHVGGLNLLRRNMAKRAIEKLQKITRRKPRMDHSLIKRIVEESEKEILAECDKKGNWAFREVGLDPKKADPKLVNLMGRLYFRTSYGQNVLFHTIEMTHAARVIAELIGSDVDTAVQGTFFHDLGKAVDHDLNDGTPHDELSKNLLEEFGYPEAVVHAAYAHHDRTPCVTPADFIVKAADGISGSRPGARQESIVQYIERMKQLEAAAKSFGGVNKVFTMSAGREVRAIVNKDQIKDEQMLDLAEGIADKISEEVSFPGSIKVNLIRITKSVDYAREKKNGTYSKK